MTTGFSRRAYTIKDKYISDVKAATSSVADSYLASLPTACCLSSMEQLPFDVPIIFLAGRNDTGKSIPSEVITVSYGFNPERGTRNLNFSTQGSHSSLHEHTRLGRGDYPKDGYFLRAKSLYNLASNIDEPDQYPNHPRHIIDSYDEVSLYRQSHGESLLSLIHNRLSGNGLCLLDESETAPPPSCILTLVIEVHEPIQQSSQFPAATHSPMFMAYPYAKPLEFSEVDIQKVSCKNIEHYRLTRRFPEQPKRYLSYLLEERGEK